MIKSSEAPDTSADAAQEPVDPPVHRGTDGHSYAVVRGRSLRLDGQEFRQIVRFDLLFQGGPVPTSERQRTYIDGLLARAHSMPPEPTHIRVCKHEGKLYVDLANALGDVIEIDAAGVRVAHDCPVRFLRSRGTGALPRPTDGGDVELLRPFARMSDAAFRLFVAHLTYLFCTGPQPLMVFGGEQGRSKSTVAKMVQTLCDPRSPGIRQVPPSRRDLVVAASYARLLSFDNISELKSWLSDALCTLSTGGGYGLRRGHTDDEEMTFEALRPVILNGIGSFVTRDDLRDRCIFYDLEPIKDQERRPEEDLWREFRAAVPSILGGLFSLCSRALALVDTLKPESLPRMADFFIWALAVEAAAGWPSGTIESAFRDQRALGDAEAMENDIVLAVSALLKETPEWAGTASALLEALRAIASSKGLTLPRSAASLGSELRRLAPLLRRNGFRVETPRSAASRGIVLRRNAPSSPSLPSSSTPASAESGAALPRAVGEGVAPSVQAKGGRDGNDGNDSNDGTDGASPWDVSFTSVAEVVDLSGFLELDDASPLAEDASPANGVANESCAPV